MNQEKEEGTGGLTTLQDFIHDTGSLAGTLKGAALIFEQSSLEKRNRLLNLMVENSQKLAKIIADFQKRNVNG